MTHPPTEPTAPRPLAAGTVTRLAAQQRKKDRVSVFIDGAFAFGVHVDLVVEFGLHKGQALTVDAQQRLIDADRRRTARTLALDYLSRRPRTAYEVRQKLRRSDFDETVIDETVARLHDLGYLDDAAYAQAYVAARFRNKGYGPQRLRADLQRRGVASPLIDAALEAALDPDDLLEAARMHARKRWTRLAGEPDPRKRRKKLNDYLLRRGFSYDVIRCVVEELAGG